MTDNGRSRAFPFTYTDSVNVEPGLTKREMFAMTAMQGMLSNSNLETWMDLNEIPSLAIKMADKIMGQLESNKDI